MAARKKNSESQDRKRVLILGGGFGGVRAALRLDQLLPKDWSIVVVDKKGYHLPQWMLYETATVHMPKEEAADFRAVRLATGIPFSRIFSGTRVSFLQAEVKDVLLAEKKAALSFRNTDGTEHLGFISFAYAVLALGGETNYFNIAGMSQEALPMKNLDDALNVRNAIEELCARKQSHENIQIVIGGGGFTGVELAAEMSGFLGKLSEKYKLDRKRIRVSVVEANSCLLPGAKRWVAVAAQKRLLDLGISVVTSSPIERYFGGQIFLSGGKIMPADILIWTAGIRANPILEHITGVELTKTCLAVDEHLELKGYTDIFAVGDNVFCFDEEKKCAVPATAQRALDQADVAARNIAALVRGGKMRPYKPQDPAFIVPLGGKYGIADMWGVAVSGSLAWVLKMLVGLRYLCEILPLPTAFMVWIEGVRVSVRND